MSRKIISNKIPTRSKILDDAFTIDLELSKTLYDNNDKVDEEELDILLQVSNWLIKNKYLKNIENLRFLVLEFFKQNSFINVQDGIKELEICISYLVVNDHKINQDSVQDIFEKFQKQPALKYLV